MFPNSKRCDSEDKSLNSGKLRYSNTLMARFEKCSSEPFPVLMV